MGSESLLQEIMLDNGAQYELQAYEQGLGRDIEGQWNPTSGSDDAFATELWELLCVDPTRQFGIPHEIPLVASHEPLALTSDFIGMLDNITTEPTQGDDAVMTKLSLCKLSLQP